MSSVMLIRGESCLLSAALAVVLVASAAYGQRPASSPGSLENVVAEIRAENAALRDQLRRVEEQQNILVELVGELRQRLETATTAVSPVDFVANPAERRAFRASNPATSAPAVTTTAAEGTAPASQQTVLLA